MGLVGFGWYLKEFVRELLGVLFFLVEDFREGNSLHVIGIGVRFEFIRGDEGAVVFGVVHAA